MQEKIDEISQLKEALAGFSGNNPDLINRVDFVEALKEKGQIIVNERGDYELSERGDR